MAEYIRIIIRLCNVSKSKEYNVLICTQKKAAESVTLTVQSMQYTIVIYGVMMHG